MSEKRKYKFELNSILTQTKNFQIIFGMKKEALFSLLFLFGDPKGIWTPDTAVKGRCLNRLTMGPCKNFGSGGRIRTNDLPGMNRPL